MSHNLRTLGAAAKAYAFPRQVGYLIFYVTNRCNFRCPFCFYSDEIEKGLKPDEMTVAEIERFARSIGPLVQLSLTGGEVFVRREAAEIAELFLDHTRARYVTIPTNASLTDRMVAFLERVLPRYPGTYFRITFSIEGIGDDHDRARRVPGSYEKIKKSYHALTPLRRAFANLTLDANSVFTAESEDRLLDTMMHLSKAFDFDNLSVTYARGDVPDPELKKVSEQKYRAVDAALRKLERRAEGRSLYWLWRGARDASRDMLMDSVFDDKFVAPCVAGRKLVVVNETGDVFPCEMLDPAKYRLGSLRDYDWDLGRLLADSNSQSIRDWIVNSKCKCSWECSNAANIVWNPSQYPRLLRESVRNIGSRRSQ